MPSELGETENWVRVIGAKPGASVLVCCMYFLWSLPNAGEVAKSGRLGASDLAPITATAQTPDGCPWSCLYSPASKVISVNEASHSLWPRYHHWGPTEKCVKVRERPSSHRPVSASILCFMAWPSDNTKFELDYLSYFEILVAARKITRNILDISPNLDDHFIKYLMGSI